KLVEKSAMSAEHYCRWTHRRTRAGSNCLGGGCVMALGSPGEFAAHIGKRRLRQHPTRHRCEDPVRVQQLSRQEQPLSLRIPGEVAKYVGELQRAAQFRRNALARGRFIAEYAQQEPAEGNPTLAIAIQLREAGRSNVAPRLHLCAIDDGEKI